MNSPTVLGNRPLTPQQQDGLAWVGRWGGRDVVLAIANELRKAQAKQPKLAGLQFRAYSAGQLYLLNGQLAPANRNPDASRRRIEVRFTRTGETQTAQ